MLKIKEISLQNFITYKKAKLSLEEDGIYVIHGLNRDRPNLKSSNGSGKSVIVGVLPSLRFGSTPTPLKSKKVIKEGFTKDTEQVLKIEDAHGNIFDIKKWFKGTTKLSIYKNNKNLKFREKNAAQHYFEKLLPLNEDQFYTLAYLDTKRPPMLQYGTDAQRHHFIESLYSLDIYDRLAEYVKKDWQKTQILVQEISVLDRQLSIRSKDIIDDPKNLEIKYEKLLSEVEKIRTKVTDYLKQLQECRTYITISDGIETDSSLDEVKQKLDSCISKLKDCRKAYNSAVEQNKKQEAFEEIENTRKSIVEQLKEYKNVKVDKSIQTTLKEDKKLLESLEEQEIVNKKAKANIKILEMELNECAITDKYKKQAKVIGIAKLQKQVVKEKLRIKEKEQNLQETKDHLGGHSDAPCPICETLLDEKTLKLILSNKEQELYKSKKTQKILSSMIEYIRLVEELEENKNNIKECTVNPIELQAKIENNEKQLGFMRKKVILKGQLDKLPILESADIVELEPLENKIKVLEYKKEKLERTKKSLIDLENLGIYFDNIKEANSKKNSLEEALAQYQPLLDKAQKNLTTVTINKTRAETASKEIEQLSTQITELSLKAADHNIKTALRKAFGPRGIRKQRVAEIGLAIQSAFNDNAQYVFDFPIKFELVITETKFQILAFRNNIWSDVRTLSGAESRAFTLLTLISLIQFCPPAQRLDSVILDEMESNLDSSFRDRYVNSFIPRLQKLVPKVIVVTPLSEKEMFIPRATVYKAVKHKGISTLQRL